jgi:hypothetical protein
MVDTEGNMTTSCDCRDSVGPNCLHCLVIERHHTEFEEPVLEGEEPKAFLIYNRRHELLYLVSVATASGSARHHTSIRCFSATIEQCYKIVEKLASEQNIIISPLPLDMLETLLDDDKFWDLERVQAREQWERLNLCSGA